MSLVQTVTQAVAAWWEEGSLYHSLIMSSSCIQPDAPVRARRHLCVPETTWAFTRPSVNPPPLVTPFGDSLRSSCWAGPCPITPSVSFPATSSTSIAATCVFVLAVKSPAVCHFISVPARFTFVLFTPLIVSRSNLLFPFRLPAALITFLQHDEICFRFGFCSYFISTLILFLHSSQSLMTDFFF